MQVNVWWSSGVSVGVVSLTPETSGIHASFRWGELRITSLRKILGRGARLELMVSPGQPLKTWSDAVSVRGYTQQ